MEWNETQLERHSRQIILSEVGIEGVEAFSKARVLLIGLGGLGSPAALYLAGAGIGTLGLADFDEVNLSNLQRQILFTEEDLGKSKALQAKAKLQSLNSDIQLVIHSEKITPENVEDIIEQYDYILEGSDNFATKYLINDACILKNKPFSIAGILRFHGQIMTCIPQKSACFRCLFPSPPPKGQAPSCAEAGILGPVAGIIGSMQALEALKYFAKAGDLLLNRYALFDLLRFKNQILKFTFDSECEICSKHANQKLLKYDFDQCQI